jgi:protein-arginine kinase activator protein McsA
MEKTKWCEWCDIEPATVFVAKKFRVDRKKFSGWVCKDCQKELLCLDEYLTVKKPISFLGRMILNKRHNIIRQKWGHRIKCG